MFSFSSSSWTACATTPTASLMWADSFLPLMSCSPMMPARSRSLETGQTISPKRPHSPALTVWGVTQGVPRDLALPHQPHVPRARHVQHRGCAVHGGSVVLAVGQTRVTSQDSSSPYSRPQLLPLACYGGACLRPPPFLLSGPEVCTGGEAGPRAFPVFSCWPPLPLGGRNRVQDDFLNSDNDGSLLGTCSVLQMLCRNHLSILKGNAFGSGWKPRHSGKWQSRVCA